jgi:hypothetical protein
LDALDLQPGCQAAHERKVCLAHENVLARHRAERAVTEDEAPLALGSGLEALFFQDCGRGLKKPVPTRA